MRSMLTGLLTVAFALGIAGTADASAKKVYRTYTYYTYVDDDSPSAIARRQRHASTFDETEYYERDSRKIPFGTAEWWRQMEREGGGRRR